MVWKSRREIGEEDGSLDEPLISSTSQQKELEGGNRPSPKIPSCFHDDEESNSWDDFNRFYNSDQKRSLLLVDSASTFGAWAAFQAEARWLKKSPDMAAAFARQIAGEQPPLIKTSTRSREERTQGSEKSDMNTENWFSHEREESDLSPPSTIITEESTESLAKKLHQYFHSSLAPYEPKDVPAANNSSSSLNQDVLVQILLFLPLHLPTLSSARLVSRNWYFFCKFLPHWSYYSLEVKLTRSSLPSTSSGERREEGGGSVFGASSSRSFSGDSPKSPSLVLYRPILDSSSTTVTFSHPILQPFIGRYLPLLGAAEIDRWRHSCWLRRAEEEPQPNTALHDLLSVNEADNEEAESLFRETTTAVAAEIENFLCFSEEQRSLALAILDNIDSTMFRLRMPTGGGGEIQQFLQHTALDWGQFQQQQHSAAPISSPNSSRSEEIPPTASEIEEARLDLLEYYQFYAPSKVGKFEGLLAKHSKAPGDIAALWAALENKYGPKSAVPGLGGRPLPLRQQGYQQKLVFGSVSTTTWHPDRSVEELKASSSSSDCDVFHQRIVELRAWQAENAVLRRRMLVQSRVRTTVLCTCSILIPIIILGFTDRVTMSLTGILMVPFFTVLYFLVQRLLKCWVPDASGSEWGSSDQRRKQRVPFETERQKHRGQAFRIEKHEAIALQKSSDGWAKEVIFDARGVEGLRCRNLVTVVIFIYLVLIPVFGHIRSSRVALDSFFRFSSLSNLEVSEASSAVCSQSPWSVPLTTSFSNHTSFASAGWKPLPKADWEASGYRWVAPSSDKSLRDWPSQPLLYKQSARCWIWLYREVQPTDSTLKATSASAFLSEGKYETFISSACALNYSKYGPQGLQLQLSTKQLFPTFSPSDVEANLFWPFANTTGPFSTFTNGLFSTFPEKLPPFSGYFNIMAVEISRPEKMQKEDGTVSHKAWYTEEEVLNTDIASKSAQPLSSSVNNNSFSTAVFFQINPDTVNWRRVMDLDFCKEVSRKTARDIGDWLVRPKFHQANIGIKFNYIAQEISSSQGAKSRRLLLALEIFILVLIASSLIAGLLWFHLAPLRHLRSGRFAAIMLSASALGGLILLVISMSCFSDSFAEAHFYVCPSSWSFASAGLTVAWVCFIGLATCLQVQEVLFQDRESKTGSAARNKLRRSDCTPQETFRALFE